MNNHSLLQQEIEQKPELPVISPDISYLMKVLNNDETGYQELAEELEKYPSIAIKIVVTANSAWASPVSPITTLRDSCARIGVPAVRSISIALSISQIFNPALCASFDAQKFWISALLTAEAAYLCAKDKLDTCPDTARLAGLLHNIGLLWLASQKPVETNDAIILKQANKNYTLSESLIEQFGMDSYTAGGYLASYMELPEIMESIIASPAADNKNSDSLIQNHYDALQLSSSVLQMVTAENENIKCVDCDPCFEKLSEKLPSVKSLVQALFF